MVIVVSGAVVSRVNVTTTGVGAGSFRFLFPTYQHRHPELVAVHGRRMFWEHAHNDVVQTPIELGVAGTGLALSTSGR